MKVAGSFLQIQDDKEKIDQLNKCVDIMHFDVMDGKFTENKTISYTKMKNNTIDVTKPKDIHLMVEDIRKYVNNYSKLKPDNITFHVECGDVLNNINYIKKKGIDVGIAINPDTDVLAIVPYLDKVDLVLVMAVTPGKGGQKFIDISHKIDYLRNYREENNLDYLIEVDGGINNITVDKVITADIVVSGSYITDSNNYEKKVELLKKINYNTVIGILIYAIFTITVLTLLLYTMR